MSGRSHDQPVAAEQPAGPSAQPLYPTQNDRYTADRCNLYQKEFMKCLDQANGDSNQCQGFWEAMKVRHFIFSEFQRLFFSFVIFRNVNVIKVHRLHSKHQSTIETSS